MDLEGDVFHHAGLGDVVRVFIPTDGLWRGVIYGLEPPVVLLISVPFPPNVFSTSDLAIPTLILLYFSIDNSYSPFVDGLVAGVDVVDGVPRGVGGHSA